MMALKALDYSMNTENEAELQEAYSVAGGVRPDHEAGNRNRRGYRPTWLREEKPLPYVIPATLLTLWRKMRTWATTCRRAEPTCGTIPW